MLSGCTERDQWHEMGQLKSKFRLRCINNNFESKNLSFS